MPDLDLERLAVMTERWRVAVRSAREREDDGVRSRSVFLLCDGHDDEAGWRGRSKVLVCNDARGQN
jgi:hypothetical protein